MTSHLEQLKKWTTIVADTGDIASIQEFKPQDATTNPSLIYQAAQLPQYASLIQNACKRVKTMPAGKERLDALIDHLTVDIGCEILKIVPGRVSTEVDARLSFDKEGSIRRGKGLIALYEKAGIDRKRVLIKLASTWEGICAAKELEKEGIHCNLTLLFCLTQAVACAEGKITLISPFVGRILDWHKKDRNVDAIAAEEDPGVLSVREIYTYYKHFAYKTEVMGASFRTADEIVALAGCDLLTIAPKLLGELKGRTGPIECKLSPEHAQAAHPKKIDVSEKNFRFLLNEDACATEKLAEGIRNFSKDLIKLEKLLEAKMV